MREELKTISKEENIERKEQGRYVYCVADSNKQLNFGKIGIESNEVYTIPCQGISAIVHDCKAEPYKSDDKEKVKGWIKAHQNVIDIAIEKLGTVIPLSFDVIIKGDNNKVLDWLKAENEILKKKIEKIKGKQEFGIQILWDKELIGKKIAETNEEIKKLRTEMEESSRGRAYFYKEKIEQILKREMEKEADKIFKEFYNKIKKYADDIKVEKIKDKDMLMNLSCLVFKDKVKELGAELDKINKTEGFSVKFTGPWPPYSFVSPG
ncbi:MAG: GvpL/GvpF family gas vesicle protein [Nanoarchaeota archaeon]|nr:GvpL/GvpF family gas vesicle protein [Nanoarchaeota archaeon]